MKSARVFLILVIVILLATAGCKFNITTSGATTKATTKAGATTATTKAGATTTATTRPGATTTKPVTTTTATTKSGATTKGTSISGSTVFTNSLLTQGMNKTDSFTRTSKVTTTSPGYTPDVVIYGFANVRLPLSDQYILDMVSAGAYNEDITIKDTYYNRTEKNGKWDKYGPGDWSSEKPLAFEYILRVTDFPITYDKLTFTKVGPEKVNNVDCIRYKLSGTYQEIFTPDQTTEKIPTSVTISGEVWIADGSVVAPALIRQRILAKVDTTMVDKTHLLSDINLEDDLTNINSTKINPPA
jgi:hypothetical protein